MNKRDIRYVCMRIAGEGGEGVASDVVAEVCKGRGEHAADVGQAVAGGGLEAARTFILGAVGPSLRESAKSETHENYKSVLQQHSQRHLAASPRYEALDEQGPDHSKCFEICVIVGGEQFPSAWGPTKKEAEQRAAQRALEALGALPRDNDEDAAPA